MAIATGTAIAIAAGTAAAAGGAQAIGGAVRAKRAKRDLENFQRQEVTDLAQNMRVSTLEQEQVMESAAASEATAVDALQAGGARAVIGGTGNVQQQRAAVTQQQAARTDAKLADVENRKYQEQVRRFGVVESRQNQEIAGMAAEMQAGRQAVQAGFQTIASAGTSAVSALSAMPAQPGQPT